MILVDSSAWIDFDQANGSSAHLALKALIEEGAQQIACSEPIMMEVLVGAKFDGHRRRLERLLRSISWLPFDSSADFKGAEQIYRACRQRGVTPRGLVDCMIVNVALRNDAALLTSDADFERIATVVPLRLHL